jgi:hypothetical protein
MDTGKNVMDLYIENNLYTSTSISLYTHKRNPIFEIVKGIKNPQNSNPKEAKNTRHRQDIYVYCKHVKENY